MRISIGPVEKSNPLGTEQRDGKTTQPPSPRCARQECYTPISKTPMPDPPFTTDLLEMALRLGAFPMGEEDGSINWYQPHERAIFPLNGFHVSRSLAKTLRQRPFEIRHDTAYEQVMRACRRPSGNWINEEIIRVYTDTFRQGWGHCTECWRDGQLVGGVYGVALGSAFFAESMFHRETGASKIALKAMIDWCAHRGYELFDVQMMTPHLASLGAVEIPHHEYMARLSRALERTAEGARQPSANLR